MLPEQPSNLALLHCDYGSNHHQYTLSGGEVPYPYLTKVYKVYISTTIMASYNSGV